MGSTGSQTLYSTYVGSPAGDNATGIAVDTSGAAYILGYTSSPSFPTTPGAFQTVLAGAHDAFIVKLSPLRPEPSNQARPILRRSRHRPAFACGSAIAVDSTGAPWIAGTPSPVFPTASPFRIQSGDGFVSKLSPDLTQLLFSTYTDNVAGGQTNPLSTDGEVYNDPLPQPVGAVTVLAGSPDNLANPECGCR